MNFSSMRLMTLVLAVAGLVGCGGGGGGSTPAPVVRQWSLGTVIDPNFNMQGISAPIYAADAQGNRVLLMLGSDDAVATVSSMYYTASTKTWGAVEPVQTPGNAAWNPSLAMTDSGMAIACWAEATSTSSQLCTATFTLATGWSTPKIISSPVYTFQLAAQGNAALLVWSPTGNGNTLSASRFTTATGWGEVETLPAEAGTNSYLFTTAMNAAGDLAVVWDEITNSPSEPIFATLSSPGADWSTPVQLNAAPVPGVAGHTPRAVMDASGKLLVTWAQYRDADYPALAEGTYFNTYTKAAGWGTPAVAVSEVLGSLTLNPQGQILALGVTPNPVLGNAEFTLTSAFYDGASWRDLGAFAPAPAGATGMPNVSVAVDTSGNFLFAYMTPEAAPNNSVNDPWTATFTVAGTPGWTAPVKFNGANATNVQLVQIIALPGGDAAAIWMLSQNTGLSSISGADYH